MTKWMAIVVIALLIVGCTAAVAEEGKTPIALSYAVYYPSNSTTSDVFGNSWSGFGLSILRPQDKAKWDTLVTFHGGSSSRSGADASLFGVEYGVQRGFGGDEKAQPFVILGVGPFHGRVDTPTVDESKWGINASATVGVLFNDRFQVAATYDVYSKVGGFNFNGLTLSAGIKLFDIK